MQFHQYACRFAISFLFASLVLTASSEEFPPQPPVKPLTAEEEAKTFQLPPGYRMELLLSEPVIREPVAVAYDGNGRMFVVEMRSYMQDANGTNELVPTSRVSLHWSSKGDGVYDKHTVFADNLLLPRMVLPLGKGQALINETNTLDVYLYTDSDGDGVSDKKELWYAGGPRGGNLEHQPSGLLWALDNGIYTTYNAYRLRWTPKGAVKEPTAPNNGQWGVGQDNQGRIFFMNAGGEKGPQSFQASTVYGQFNPKAQFAPGFEEVWPAVGVADVQGGHSRHRPDGTLNHFTATSGAEVFRGDRLPAEVQGDLFFGEPVGRLVRRAKVEVKEGLTVLSNPHQEQRTEFLRSTDLCFRPLNFASAPDGTLHIVDMYRGIIQEGNWTRPESYLRKVIDQYSFGKIIGRGRIWRLVHESTKLGPQPRMYEEGPEQLIAHLAHPNGWWRDMAQRLLILRQEKAVIPALAEVARSHGNHLARVHALWTLEGLDSITPGLVRAALGDKHPQVRVAGIRVSETLFRKGGAELAPEILAMATDADAEVVMQSFLTANLLKLTDARKHLTDLVATSSFRGVKEIGGLILNPPTAPVAKQEFSAEQKKAMKAGAETYNTLCAACHGPDGKGMPLAGAPAGHMLAPALAGSKTVTGPRDGAALVLLHGLVGDIDGKKYEGIMIPMANNDDAWIANVTSYVRNSFGNRAGFVTPSDVARLRAAFQQRTQPWTIQELRAALPKPIERKGWKVSASHNSPGATAAIDNDVASRWDTKASQANGMWYQVELPTEVEISSIELDAGKSVNDYPRGYQVLLSADGQQWSKPVATGKGAGAVTEIEFPPAKAKFIRITQTGAVNGLFWSIHEMQVFAAR
jgi:mono/diheme cytochrome c family protein/glucose/arabinose dehydrogenase